MCRYGYERHVRGSTYMWYTRSPVDAPPITVGHDRFFLVPPAISAKDLYNASPYHLCVNTSTMDSASLQLTDQNYDSPLISPNDLALSPDSKTSYYSESPIARRSSLQQGMWHFSPSMWSSAVNIEVSLIAHSCSAGLSRAQSTRLSGPQLGPRSYSDPTSGYKGGYYCAQQFQPDDTRQSQRASCRAANGVHGVPSIIDFHEDTVNAIAVPWMDLGSRVCQRQEQSPEICALPHAVTEALGTSRSADNLLERNVANPEDPTPQPRPTPKRSLTASAYGESDGGHFQRKRVCLTATSTQPRLPHSVVERRYRDNLNNQIDALRLAIPSLVTPPSDCNHLEEVIHHRPASKAMVIVAAGGYIKQLETDRRRLLSYTQALEEQIYGLRKLVRCDDYSVLQYLKTLRVASAHDLEH